MTVAAAPLPLEARVEHMGYSMGDSDMDAEGDEEFEEEDQLIAETAEDYDEDADGSDANVEGDSDDEDDDNDGNSEDDISLAAPSRRTRARRRKPDSEAAIVDRMSDGEGSSDAAGSNSSGDSSDADSVVAEAWDGGSEAADEASVQLERRNNCVFCDQDEENDPSEEFEEYMACAVCGDHAHRQCARDAKSLKTDDEVTQWRCPACVENNLEPSAQIEVSNRRRSSATKFTRDLLPAPRGGSRPGSHSVFNTLILDDDPLDGSRSLRKRKSSSEQQEEPKKRSRPQSVLANELEAAGVIKASSEEHPENATEKDDENVSVSTRKSRPSRSSKKRSPDVIKQRSVSVVEKRTGSIIISFPVEPSKLASLAKSKPKKKRPRPRESFGGTQKERERTVQPATTHYATPFYAFHERENDELKSKPYGGVLTEAEADTSKTLPLHADRTRFNEARQKAEDDWKLKVANSEGEGETKGRVQKLAGPPTKIKCVNFGGYEIETWYAAPYPEEYSRNKVLYICEFCLKYMNSDFVAWRHKLKCPAKHPPGDEIYRDGSVSVFEVDGRKNPVYCQNLCLLAKLFLGSKTLYYDVEPFLFYVMTEYDEFGCHFVGYFSKEKRPSSQNNVSCILTLPTHQRKGYGNLLISFSYLLTRVEGKTGSPEKPLSDMGLVSYRNYWRLVLSYELLNQKQPLSILELSDRTGMTADDIVAALEGLRALVRDPITRTYALRLDYEYFRQCISEWEAKKYVTLNSNALVWTPYIMGRSNLAHYETAPPLPTVAPREGEDEEQQAAPEEGIQQAVKADAVAAAQVSEGKANENAIADDDGGQPLTNGYLNGSQSQVSSKDLDDIDPASSQLVGSTPIPPVSFNAPIQPPTVSSPPPNGISHTSAPQQTPIIPPIRYEVFPPIPGTNARRRGGWKGGSRKPLAKGKGTPSATPSTRRNVTGLGIARDNLISSSRSQKTGTPVSTRRTRLGGAFDGGGDTPKRNVSDEDDDVEKDANEAALPDNDEAPEDEKNSDGDEVVEDEATADADYGEGEDAEESEVESDEEDDAMDD
ncbi:Histone acetyltransferase [Lecanora helva]